MGCDGSKSHGSQCVKGGRGDPLSKGSSPPGDARGHHRYSTTFPIDGPSSPYEGSSSSSGGVGVRGDPVLSMTTQAPSPLRPGGGKPPRPTGHHYHHHSNTKGVALPPGTIEQQGGGGGWSKGGGDGLSSTGSTANMSFLRDQILNTDFGPEVNSGAHSPTGSIMTLGNDNNEDYQYHRHHHHQRHSTWHRSSSSAASPLTDKGSLLVQLGGVPVRPGEEGSKLSGDYTAYDNSISGGSGGGGRYSSSLLLGSSDVSDRQQQYATDRALLEAAERDRRESKGQIANEPSLRRSQQERAAQIRMAKRNAATHEHDDYTAKVEETQALRIPIGVLRQQQGDEDEEKEVLKAREANSNNVMTWVAGVSLAQWC